MIFRAMYAGAHQKIALADARARETALPTLIQHQATSMLGQLASLLATGSV